MYVQCDVGNVVHVRFKGGMWKNGHLTDHVQVAHDQNVAHVQKLLHMIKNFDGQKILTEKLILVKNMYLAKSSIKFEK